MVAIDNVAIQQGGGAWIEGGKPSLLQHHPISFKNRASQFSHQESTSSFASPESQCSDGASMLTQDTQCPSSASLSTQDTSSPQCPDSNSSASLSTQETTTVSKKSDTEGSRTPTNKRQGGSEIGVYSGAGIVDELLDPPPTKRPKTTTQYLCSGYDLFSTKEPCVM